MKKKWSVVLNIFNTLMDDDDDAAANLKSNDNKMKHD